MNPVNRCVLLFLINFQFISVYKENKSVWTPLPTVNLVVPIRRYPFACPGSVPAYWNGAHLSTLSSSPICENKLEWLAVKPITAIWPNPITRESKQLHANTGLQSLAAADSE